MHNSFCTKSRKLASQIKQLHRAMADENNQPDANFPSLSEDSRERIQQAIQNKLDLD